MSRNSNVAFVKPTLEHLEDRLVPAFFTPTYTNATVEITPGLTVTETVTAKVTNFPGFSFNNGQFSPTPIPSNATQPTQGTVLFSLNNQMAKATLNSNGEATATFQVPLLAFLSSQTLQVSYQGFFDNVNNNDWFPSTFLAPLYKNFNNVIFPGTLTFNQLTPQQFYAEEISRDQTGPPTFAATTLNPFYTAAGETDSVAGGLIAFKYIDPGTIDSITALGMQLPGIFALQLGAFKGLT